MRAARLAAPLLAILVLAGCTPTTPAPPAPSSTVDSTESTVDYAAGRSDPVRDPVYPRYGNPALDVLGYRLALSWRPEPRELSGTATIVIRTTQPVDRLSLDFAPTYTVDGATLDGAPVTSSFDGDDLVVPARLGADARTTLEVRYHGAPAPVAMPSQRGDTREGLGLRSTVEGEAWTMQEPYGAGTWYPANDLVSDEALYDTVVTVPAGWAGVAQGRLVGVTHGDGTDTYTWQARDPVAAYVATLAVGRYTRVDDTGPHGLALTYWLRTGRDEAYEPVARRTPELLAWLEQRFGPYPFPSAGVVFVDSASAMETQQMVTYGAGLGGGPANQNQAAETLLHEYAHQWFGDSVTPTDWTGVWLNEGFAMYAEMLWTIDQGIYTDGAWVQSARAYDIGYRASAGPPGHPAADHFAEPNVYFGPALMLRELHHALGDDAFFALARDWVQTQRNHQVDRAAFTHFVNRHTGRDFTALIDAWLDSPTTPVTT